MDDWYAEVDDGDARPRDRPPGQRPRRRRPRGGRAPWPSASTPPPTRSSSPAPTSTPAAAGTLAVALAERQRLPVWASPATGGVRLGFPEDHPNFRGVLPPAIGPVGQTLEGHDLILVVGSSVFPYYPLHPRAAAARGRAAGRDHQRPRRGGAGADGRRDRRRRRAHPGGAAGGGARVRRARRPSRNPGPQEIPPTDPLNPSTVHTALAEVLPEDAIVVLESPSSTLALRNQLRLSRPGSYYFSAGGGLGFGLAASVGVQLAQPDRPVVCVLGEGSAQYAITAFWSAVAYKTPVTFLVLRNEEYAILKWFAGVEQVERRPRPRPARARRRRRRRRLRGRVDPRQPTATRSATRSRRRSPPRRPSWSKSRSRRGCPSSSRDGAARAEPRRARPRRSRAGPRPRPRRRSPPASPSRCAASSRRCSAPTASSAAPPTSSATPPTPAPTGASRGSW